MNHTHELIKLKVSSHARTRPRPSGHRVASSHSRARKILRELDSELTRPQSLCIAMYRYLLVLPTHVYHAKHGATTPTRPSSSQVPAVI